MKPATPPVSSTVFKAPNSLDESQVHAIAAYKNVIPPGSNLDGAAFVTVAWRPTPEELIELNNGGLVYITTIGGLLPHFVTTSFSVATYGLER